MQAENERRFPVNLPEHFLVTGGAGFIGSYLVERLLADGKAVTVIDDLSTGNLDNLQAVISNPNLRVIESKVSECRALSEIVAESESIYHLAAAVGVELVVNSPIRKSHTNLRETAVVLGAASRYGVSIQYTSSLDVS